MFDPKLEIKAYLFENGELAFGAGTPEGVLWLEQNLKPGRWEEDEDGRPLWTVGALEAVTVRFASERPICGHSICSQSYIDTGDGRCKVVFRAYDDIVVHESCAEGVPERYKAAPWQRHELQENELIECAVCGEETVGAEFKPEGDGGPPYDAATATGMYDREEG